MITVGAVFAVTPVTQRFPPIQRRTQITTLCDTLSVSPNTPIPGVGQEGVIRFQCSGSVSNGLCSNWSGGLDCAFYVGNSGGGGGGFAVPTFTLPPGYLNIWVKGPATGAGQDEVQDCSVFNDPGHWLTSGRAKFLGNISHIYCAHLDGDPNLSGDIPSFEITWS